MNLIYLSNSLVPSRAANSIHVMKMSQAIASLGYKVTLVVKSYEKIIIDEQFFNDYGVEPKFSLKVFKLLKIRGANILNLGALYKFLQVYKRKPTIIYSRDIYGAVLALVLGYKIIYESHSLPAHKIIKFLEAKILKHKNTLKFIVISKALKGFYEQLYGRKLLIHVYHDAADLSKLSNKTCYEWPSKRNTLQVGYIGHLYRGRGIDIILSCAKGLQNYDFHIIGGTEKDIQFWKKRNLNKNVFFHGFVKPSLTSYVRDKCDVLLMPYQKELSVAGKNINTSSWMSPMKLFEYMASNKAIISSDLPVLREILNENNAILVHPNNVDQWVKAIKLLDDKNKRDKLAKYAYEDFISKYTWTNRAKSILDNVCVE